MSAADNWTISEPWSKGALWLARIDSGSLKDSILGPCASARTRDDLLAVIDIVERRALESEMLPEGATFRPSTEGWRDGERTPVYQGGVLGPQIPADVDSEVDDPDAEHDLLDYRASYRRAG